MPNEHLSAVSLADVLEHIDVVHVAVDARAGCLGTVVLGYGPLHLEIPILDDAARMGRAPLPKLRIADPALTAALERRARAAFSARISTIMGAWEGHGHAE